MSSLLRLATLFLFSAGSADAGPKEITFCHYNVENYLSEELPREGQKLGVRAKPEAEIEALVQIIREIAPDILGICEMGSRERFADFQHRLARAGLEYAEAEYVDGPDQSRHLGLFSRFPIVARHSRVDVPFELSGLPEKVRRGILDVVVQVTPDYRLRLVGVHLKSKLPSPEGEALIRRFEAQQVRRHVEAILVAERGLNLLCYGDFNDTKNEPTFQEISGVRGTPGFLSDLPAADDRGDRWTHYWKVADVYSRIDYLFASPGLIGEVVKNSAKVYGASRWKDASDHRPIFARISPVDR